MKLKRFVGLLVIAFCAWSSSALTQGAGPPRATPVENLIKDSTAVFVGRVVFAKQTNDDSYVYGVAIRKMVAGRASSKCLTGGRPLSIGVSYIFFPIEEEGRCMSAGSFLRRAMEIRKLEGDEYVILSDDKLLYPNFKDDLVVVQSEPVDGGKPIVLWTGVRFKKFLEFVEATKGQHSQDAQNRS